MKADHGALPRRIAVIGTSGSGKTTLARQLAQRLDVPHVELDAIHWGPDWTPMPFDLFRKRLEDVLRADGWVTDGNYGRERDLVWSRANSLIWLDHSLPLVMGRVVSRTLRCCLTREQLWNGNQERFREAFLGRDSIVLWALTTYGRRRREYPVLFCQPEYSHLQVVHLKSPGAARRWLDRQGSTTNA